MFQSKSFGKAGLAVICWSEALIKRVEFYTRDIVPAVPWTLGTLLKQYRGVEGEPWPDDKMEHVRLDGGLATVDQYEAVLRYYEDISRGQHCYLLYIQLPDIFGAFPPPPTGFSFCGYDFGYYESEGNNYSVLFNEVAFGTYNELKVYGTALNEHLLFPSLALAKDLEKTWEQLIGMGADLEIDEPSVPIAVYTPIGNP